MSENLEERVIGVIAETLRIEATSVSPSSKFVDDLGADSLDLVELMMSLEATFDCDIPDEEAAKIATVADAVAYIENHLEKK